MTDFNLNSPMAVTLTAFGHTILERFNSDEYRQLNESDKKCHKMKCDKRLSGNIYHDQAWRVMLIFGQHLGAGPMGSPFKTAVVQIDL
jgi:hypothetical protein